MSFYKKPQAKKLKRAEKDKKELVKSQQSKKDKKVQKS